VLQGSTQKMKAGILTDSVTERMGITEQASRGQAVTACQLASGGDEHRGGILPSTPRSG